MFDSYSGILKIGQDCLDPEMVRARIEHKAALLSGEYTDEIDIIIEKAEAFYVRK